MTSLYLRKVICVKQARFSHIRPNRPKESLGYGIMTFGTSACHSARKLVKAMKPMKKICCRHRTRKLQQPDGSQHASPRQCYPRHPWSATNRRTNVEMQRLRWKHASRNMCKLGSTSERGGAQPVSGGVGVKFYEQNLDPIVWHTCESFPCCRYNLNSFFKFASFCEKKTESDRDI